MAQIRRFIRSTPFLSPTPELDRRQFSPHQTYDPYRFDSVRTLIRAIRAAFERNSVSYKSSLDTSDYWRARGHRYL